MLTLFFIDEVAKYRVYDEAVEKQGEYAAIFEEEYNSPPERGADAGRQQPYNDTCRASTTAERTRVTSPSTRRASGW